MTIPEGTTLYHLWGWDEPEENGGHQWYIGDIVTTSEMTTSSFGDTELFFRHEVLDEDLALRPEWEPYEIPYEPPTGSENDKIVRKSGCPFAHLW